MSDLNEVNRPQENQTIFSEASLQFGCRDEVDKISTQEFLEDSKYVVIIIEKMGKIFAPLKHDMNGNITKITNKYSCDTIRNHFLEDMILAEKLEGGTVTIDALQWLRRALHFIARFFECVLNDAEAGNDQPTLTPFFKIAYEEILGRYHGWMGSQLFHIMCRYAPNRKELFEVLSTGKNSNDEYVLRDLRVFKTNLLTCIQRLITFYGDHNLENHTRV